MSLLFYLTVALYFTTYQKIIIEPYPDKNFYKTMSITKYSTPVINKGSRESSFILKIFFKDKKLRDKHELRRLTINGKEFSIKNGEIDCQNKYNPDSHFAYQRIYTVSDVDKADMYDIYMERISFLDFPVDSIIYRLPQSTKKFTYIAQIGNENKNHSRYFEISGTFMGVFAMQDRKKFIESTHHKFKIEIDQYTPFGAGVQIDIRPYNDCLLYDPK